MRQHLRLKILTDTGAPAVLLLIALAALVGCREDDGGSPARDETTGRRFELGETVIEFDREAVLLEMTADPRGPSGEVKAFEFEWRDRRVRVSEKGTSAAGKPVNELWVDGRSWGLLVYGDHVSLEEDRIAVNGSPRTPAPR